MKLMIIDGNSLLNRAFYGISMLTNKDGLCTNAIYGFLTTYLKLLNDENPDKTIVCFDVRAKTFRHLKYEAYKAQRKGMPEELAMQMPILKDVLDALGIDRYEKEGFEADDLIGTISHYCNQNQVDAVVVTGDKDSLQLASEHTTVNLVSTRMGKTTTKKYTYDTFVEEYEFEPHILTDLKGLMGDKSDNIAGVAGVGEKTAMTLLHAFKNLEGIYENIDSDIIKKGARQKLIDDKESAFISRELATIVTNVEFDFDISHNKQRDDKKLLELFSMLEFKTFADRFNVKKEEPKKEMEVLDKKYIKSIDELGSIISDTVFLRVYDDKVVIIVDETAYIVLESQFDGQEYLEILRLLFSEKVEKVMHDAKDTLTKLLYKGIEAQNIAFDTALAVYLLNPSRTEYLIGSVCEEILGVEVKETQEISLFNETNDDVAVFEVQCIKELYFNLKTRLLDMESLYYDIELPLMTVLAKMQYFGIKIDKDGLKEFGKELDVQIKQLTEEIYNLTGQEFNINSPKQLGEVLFTNLGLTGGKKTKTGYSTNAEVLEYIKEQHAVVPKILEYRTLTKLQSTYVEGLLKVIKDDGKIHTTFNQMVTTTGRLSSQDPNLQNIPVRTKLGSRLREMFVVSDDNNVLIDADYSQIELRILAHIANDEIMINAFKEGIDIHAVTASQVFGVDLKDVTKEMRSNAKAVNFGIVYGISAFSLANDIGVTVAEAKQYIEAYFEKYAGVRAYMDNVKAKAYEDFYVKTLFNRKRELNELKSKNFNMRSFGERVALNTPIQGTAADIIKIAMVSVQRRLENEKLKSRLILQIHDELIIESPKDEKDRVAKLLKEEMESAFVAKVPLEVDYSFGKNWLEAK